MTAVASPQQNVDPVSGRTRSRAAVLLPIGPLIMVAGYVAEYGQGSNAQGWSVFFDLLSTPFLLITITVAAAACWRATPRWSAVALAGVVCNIIGLAALHGIEAFQLVMEQSGMDKAAIESAFDAFAALPVGRLEVVLFFGGNLVGSAALIVAQFRTSTLPWRVPILNVLAVAADVTIPDSASPLVKSAGISLFVLWSVALAVAIKRPTPRAPLRRRPSTAH